MARRVPAVLGGVLITTVLVGAPTGFVFLFIDLVTNPMAEDLRPLELTVVRFLEKLPLEQYFYVSIAALAGARVWWGWYSAGQIRRDLAPARIGTGGVPLSASDLRSVKELRERALFLRVRADLILGVAVLSLLGGIYFTIFVVREVAGEDTERIEQALLTLE